jgi:opacity protein-like surface antigen
MTRFRIVLGAALALAAAAPLHAQQRIQDWQYKWYWGVGGGMMSYTLPTAGRQFTGMGGAEWLITARRVALHIGYDQSFTGAADTFAVQGLSGTNNGVSFDGMRQIQIDVVAIVGDRALQPYVGGGFVIESLTNPRSTAASPTSTQNDAIAAAASGGFLHILAGVQYRMGRKAAIFAHYSYSAQGRDFLLAGSAQSFVGGIRYAFLNAKENDPTTRR